MYLRETRVLLRHYLEQGVGKAELAARESFCFAVSGNTLSISIFRPTSDRPFFSLACARFSRGVNAFLVSQLRDHIPQSADQIVVCDDIDDAFVLPADKFEILTL